jgi:predicted DNA-binding ArsR family transcriptional regulator
MEDLNAARLKKIERILKDLSKTIGRIVKSNDNVINHISEIQNNMKKMEDPKTELHDSINRTKNNIFLLENI